MNFTALILAIAVTAIGMGWLVGNDLGDRRRRDDLRQAPVQATYSIQLEKPK